MTTEHGAAAAAAAPRGALLVGSVPGSSPREAMDLAVDTLGPYLIALPDGETGERRNWVVSTIDAMRDVPALRVSREGDWSDYGSGLRLAVRRGHTLRADDLPLGYADAWAGSRAAYEAVQPPSSRRVPFQVGLASPMDLAAFSLGPTAPLRHREAFTEATVAQVRRIQAATDHDVVFQVELPAELVLLARAPRPARRLLAGRLARGILELVRRAPAGTRWGLHLCLGDLGNRALLSPPDTHPLAVLANALVAGWPAGRTLEWLHVPLAAGDQPPRREAAVYAPLRDLAPEASRVLVAGFVHERCTEGQLRTVLGLVEEAVGHRVRVAAACGLGRRERADAVEVMERTAQLCLAT